MEQELVNENFGGEGGKITFEIADSNLELTVKYPVAAVLKPVRNVVVNVLKKIIPGDRFDYLADKAYAEVIGFFGLKESAPEAPAPAAPAPAPAENSSVEVAPEPEIAINQVQI